MKYLIAFIGILFLVQCSAPLEIAKISTKNLNDFDTAYNDYLIYNLPITTFRITFEITKTEKISGIYSDYAESLLGISNSVENYDIYYELTNCEIIPYAKTDPSSFFYIDYKPDSFQTNVNLTKQGILLGMNLSSSEIASLSNPPIKNITPFYIEEFGNTDFFVKKNVVSKSVTKYKTVRTDSSTIRIPINRSYSDIKSIKINAKEVAAFIIKLRKRKFKLLAGLYEQHPDGVGVEAMIDELKELESNYISLFTGEIKNTKQYFSFDYTPDVNNAIKKYTLAYFSELKGIFTLDELSKTNNLETGMDVRPLDVYIDADKSYLSSFDFSKAISGDGLIYRIPVSTEVKVLLSNKVLISQNCEIAQFGSYAQLSSSYLNAKYKIMLNPLTGALIRISTN